MKNFSIKGKIISITLLVVVLSFAGIGGLINHRITLALEKNAKDELLKDAEIVAQELSLEFQKYGLIAEQMTMHEDMVETVKTYKDRRDKQTLEHYRSVIKTLGKIKESDPAVLSVWLASTEASDLIIDDYDYFTEDDFQITQRPWYIQMVQNETLTFTSPYVDKLTGQRVISIVYPIMDKGVIVGATGIDVSIDAMAQYMGNYSIGAKGYPTLIDAKGIFVYHPDQNLIGTTRLSDISETLKTYEVDMLAGHKGIGNYTYKKEEKYFAYVPIHLTGWAVGASVAQSETGSVINAFARVNYGMFIGVMLILILAIYLTISRVLKDVPDLLKKMETLVDGDLTATVDLKSNDEIGKIGRGYNQAVASIKETIVNTFYASDQVKTAAAAMVTFSEESKSALNQVSLAIAGVAESTSDQAQETEKSVASIHDLSGEIDGIIETSEEIYTSTAQVHTLSTQGSKTLKALETQALENHKSVDAIKVIVTDMDTSSHEISSIVDIINEISGQTNLLALNASIEAARAGEAGRGFAVVADEIRKLAEETKQATEDIHLKITNIQEKSSLAVKQTKASETIVEANRTIVTQTETIFNEIMTNLEHLFDLTAVSKESAVDMLSRKDTLVAYIENISAGSEETSASMEEMSATTDDQLAIMDKLAQEATQMADLSVDLHKHLQAFKV